MMKLKIDNELRSLIPSLSEEEYSNLKKSIIEEGCRDAIIIWNETIIDGHNRYEICTENNIEFKTISKEFSDIEDVKDWMDLNQLSRRNLTDVQRQILIGRRYNREKKKQGGTGANQFKKEQSGKVFLSATDDDDEINDFFGIAPQKTAEKLSDEYKVSDRTVRNYGKIATQFEAIQKEKPDLAKKILDGETTFKDIIKEDRNNLKKEMYAEASINFKSDDIKLYMEDFYEFSKTLEDNSIDAIITDPPYPVEYLYLYEQMFEIANRILKPGKFLICYAGQQNLDQIFRLKNELKYYWTMKLDFKVIPLVKGRNIMASWKPVLIFQKLPFHKLENVFSDKVGEYTKFNYDDRTGMHELNWGQGIGNFEYLIDKFTLPGEIIFEPFAGTGTTLVAAQRMKRKAIGCEIDMQYKSIIEGRLVKNE